MNHNEYDVCPVCDLGKADAVCSGFIWRDEYTTDEPNRTHRMKNPARLRFKDHKQKEYVIFVEDLNIKYHERIADVILKNSNWTAEYIGAVFGKLGTPQADEIDDYLLFDGSDISRQHRLEYYDCKK